MHNNMSDLLALKNMEKSHQNYVTRVLNSFKPTITYFIFVQSHYTISFPVRLPNLSSGHAIFQLALKRRQHNTISMNESGDRDNGWLDFRNSKVQNNFKQNLSVLYIVKH